MLDTYFNCSIIYICLVYPSHTYTQENHLAKLTAQVRGAFDTPITAGVYTRLAALMVLSSNINTHITTLRSIPPCVPQTAIFPRPSEANLIALPQPKVENKSRPKKRPKPTTDSLTMASVLVESRLSYEAQQSKARHQEFVELQRARGLSWQAAYDLARTAQNTVTSRTRSGRSSTSTSTTSTGSTSTSTSNVSSSNSSSSSSSSSSSDL